MPSGLTVVQAPGMLELAGVAGLERSPLLGDAGYSAPGQAGRQPCVTTIPSAGVWSAT